VRVILVSLFKKFLPLRNAFKATYIVLGLFPIIGFLMVSVSGMPMYGFDNSNLSHQLGHILLVFSPVGIPFILGFPPIMIFDLFRKPWRSKDKFP